MQLHEWMCSESNQTLTLSFVLDTVGDSLDDQTAYWYTLLLADAQGASDMLIQTIQKMHTKHSVLTNGGFKPAGETFKISGSDQRNLPPANVMTGQRWLVDYQLSVAEKTKTIRMGSSMPSGNATISAAHKTADPKESQALADSKRAAQVQVDLQQAIALMITNQKPNSGQSEELKNALMMLKKVSEVQHRKNLDHHLKHGKEDISTFEKAVLEARSAGIKSVPELLSAEKHLQKLYEGKARQLCVRRGLEAAIFAVHEAKTRAEVDEAYDKLVPAMKEAAKARLDIGEVAVAARLVERREAAIKTAGRAHRAKRGEHKPARKAKPTTRATKYPLPPVEPVDRVEKHRRRKHRAHSPRRRGGDHHRPKNRDERVHKDHVTIELNNADFPPKRR